MNINTTQRAISSSFNSITNNTNNNPFDFEPTAEYAEFAVLLNERRDKQIILLDEENNNNNNNSTGSMDNNNNPLSPSYNTNNNTLLSPTTIHSLLSPNNSNTNINNNPAYDYSGWLYKRGSQLNTWKKRWFILQSQLLKYYKSNTNTTAVKGCIDLSIVNTVLAITPQANNKLAKIFAFNINIKTNNNTSKDYLFHCSTAAELEHWIELLQSNLEYIKRNNSKFNHSSSSNNINNNSIGSILNNRSSSIVSNNNNNSLSSFINFDNDYSDELIRRSGFTNKYSNWRKDLSIMGIKQQQQQQQSNTNNKSDKSTSNQQQQQLFNISSHSISNLIPHCSASTIHNSTNSFAIGASLTAVQSDPTAGSLSIVTSDITTPESIRYISSDRFGLLNNTNTSTNTTACRGDISDISWFDSLLLCGSSSGIVALYNQSPDQPVLNSIQPTQLYIHNKSLSVPISAPGKWLHSSRIQRVAIQPKTKKSFLSITNQSFNLWDIERPNSAVYSELGSIAPLFSCCWNPHSNGDEFLFGGVEGALRVLDSRLLSTSASKCVVWQCLNSSTEPIRTVSWSPLVQYWLASSGDDSRISIYDIRYGSEPVRILEGHQNTVTSIEWSKSHSELLCSGSVDRTVRLWNIRINPHYLVNTVTMKDSINSVGFSPTHPLLYSATSNSGEIKTIAISKEIMAQYVPHRANQRAGTAAAATVSAKKSIDEFEEKSNPAQSPTNNTNPTIGSTTIINPVRSAAHIAAEHSIEILLYQRDFAAAFSSIARLAADYWLLGNSEWASSLLKLTSPSLFNTAANESNKSFNTLLIDLSRFIPERTLKSSIVDTVTQSKIQFLKLRIALYKLIAAGKYKDILALDKEICSHLIQERSIVTNTDNNNNNSNSNNNSSTASTAVPVINLDTFDSNSLLQLVLAILPFDHIRAIEFSLRIGRTLRDAGNFGLFIGIIKYLFNPTIYDKPGNNNNTANTITTGSAASQLTKSNSSSNLSSGSYQSAVTALRNRGFSNVSNLSAVDDTDSTRDDSKSGLITEDNPNNNLQAQYQLSRGNSAASLLNQSNQSSLPPTPSRSNLTTTGTDRISTESAHAQIALDRDLRNPKIVLPQLELLYNIHVAIIAETEGINININNQSATADEPSTPSKGSASINSSTATTAAIGSFTSGPLTCIVRDRDESISRWNPYLSIQTPDIALTLTADTLYLPPLSVNSSKLIIDLFDLYQSDLRKLYPQLLHLFYYNSLIHQKKYDIVLIVGSKLCSMIKYFAFNQYIQVELFNLLLWPKLNSMINKYILDNSNTIGATNKLIPAILTLINIFYNSDFNYIPALFQPQLIKLIQSLIKLLDQKFNEILYNKGYISSNNSNTAINRTMEVKSKVDNLLSKIVSIKSKLTDEPFAINEIHSLINMLNQYKLIEN